MKNNFFSRLPIFKGDKPVQIDYPTYTRKLTYDNLQRLVKTEDDLDENTTLTRSFVYDAAGNVISETDEDNNSTNYEYDALNRLIRVTDPMNGTVVRSYDDRGNLIGIEDPNHGLTAYEYDRNNRLTRIVKPLLQDTVYEYDAVGSKIADLPPLFPILRLEHQAPTLVQ